MQIYDAIMVFMLVAATVFGAIKGIAWQAAAIASLVASYFVALRVSPTFASMFNLQPPLNRFAAMAVVYVLSGAVIWYLFWLISAAVDKVHLRVFDRQLGALFGAAKGAVLCVTITFFAVTLSEQSREAVLHSRSGHYIAALLNQAEGLMPLELHTLLDPYLHRLEKELAPASKSERQAELDPRARSR
jgi:membrane protein required for colicin V production